ncbi:MAG: hypothetical protein M1831_003340 [Alyxoria varia]|nr:MAG: hypothetical protein M1831_003340 [Alyxoria varia]
MALLARCGRLPNVPEEDILDKSKANGLAKLLVMAQASWMLLQCIGRLYARLPVTLLEVNTVAHVLCALLMYALWWHKPLLAKEPIIIRGEWVEPLCAFMLMSSEMSGNVDETSIESETVVKSLFASLHLYSRTPEIDLVAFCDGDENMGTMQMDTGNDAQLKKGQSIYTVKQSSSDCREAVQRRKLDTPDQTAFFERRPKIKATPHQGTPIANTTARRWNLATIAIHRYRTILESHVLLRHQRGTCIHFKPEELLAHRIQNWPWDDLLRNVGGLMVGMILWFSNLCYGGLHAAAWNDHFPSHAEKWLWRTSPLYIGFCGGLWICLNWLTLRCRPLNEFWERWMDGEKRWWSNIGIGLLVAVCGGALCAARCFIVVEAFVSIRSLPSSAYETPKWSQILPHF